MAFVNPVGRANYEPNSWGADGGPREDPATGLPDVPGRGVGAEAPAPAGELRRPLQPGPPVLPEPDPGRAEAHRRRVRVRAEQGRAPAIRARMVANLRNVDEDLAAAVADGLGLDLPKATTPAAAPITDLPPSPALSILANPPRDASTAARSACSSPTASTPRCSTRWRRRSTAEDVDARVRRAEGRRLRPPATARSSWPSRRSTAGRRCCTTPSCSSRAPTAPRSCRRRPQAKDFVADAYAHCKFIGYAATAQPLLDAVGALPDDGLVPLAAAGDIATFLDSCDQLRFWAREPNVLAV